MESVISNLIKTANTFDSMEEFDKANEVDSILKSSNEEQTYLILFENSQIPRDGLSLLEYMDDDKKIFASSIYEEDSFPEEPGFNGIIVNAKEDLNSEISLKDAELTGVISDTHSLYSRKMRRIARKLDIPFVQFDTIPPEDISTRAPKDLLDEIKTAMSEVKEKEPLEVEIEIPRKEQQFLKSLMTRVRELISQ